MLVTFWMTEARRGSRFSFRKWDWFRITEAVAYDCKKSDNSNFVFVTWHTGMWFSSVVKRYKKMLFIWDLRFSWWWSFMLGAWRWKQQGPLKCWYHTLTLHGITTQKILTWKLFIIVVQQFYSLQPEAYNKHHLMMKAFLCWREFISGHDFVAKIWAP